MIFRLLAVVWIFVSLAQGQQLAPRWREEVQRRAETTARILTIRESTLFYLPKDWTWSLALSEARSEFSGTGAEWRPGGMTPLGFPIAGRDEHQLAGNVFFFPGYREFRAGRSDWGLFCSDLRGRFALPTDCTPGLDGLGCLSEAHARTERRLVLDSPMESAFETLRRIGPAAFVLKAIIGTIVADVLLLGFILLRRTQTPNAWWVWAESFAF